MAETDTASPEAANVNSGRLNEQLDRAKAAGSWFGENYKNILKNTEIYLPLGVLGILCMLLLPLPTWIMDIMLAFSISTAVIVLMAVIFVDRPVRLSAFPIILLLAALLRLGLNVASTRLILSDGHTGTDAAGEIIQAFGNFVAGGSYVIGIIVFAILVIINFIVITKGSGRIAEVAARFSLDAMPGKQMAIDSEQSSGQITEEEARTRRSELQRESDFYGSMDGATKFVRGDAIAGLLITFINVIGGIIIGVMQRDMALATAAENYTLLTIGDGLVSQIPGIIISISAGILVTKSGIEGNTQTALSGQLAKEPMALIIAGMLMLALAMIPGLPPVPFLLMFLIGCGAGGYLWFRRVVPQDSHSKDNMPTSRDSADPATPRMQSDGMPEEPPEDRNPMMITALRIQIGYGLLPMLTGLQGGARETDQNFQKHVDGLRNELLTQMGFIMPKVRLVDDMNLSANEYRIFIKEIEVGRGELRPNRLLCISTDADQDTKYKVRGEKTLDPAFNVPAVWITENQREEAMFNGYTVIEPMSVLSTHLSELVKQYMSELLTYSMTQELVDGMHDMHKGLVKELIPQIFTISTLQKTLQGLLVEQVSIRDIPLIIEALGDAVMSKRSAAQSIEHVRSYLSRQICHSLADAEGAMPVVTLGARWDQILTESLTPRNESGDYVINLEPRLTRDFIHMVEQTYNNVVKEKKVTPILLVNPALRPYVRSLLYRQMPNFAVISMNEIYPKAKFYSLGEIE